MKENICTIPINDLFKPKDGCPICRMEEMLEETYVEYAVGDSMMEPNTRIQTNQKGFCHRHFSKMFYVGQKLPNALILETHLQEIIDNVMPKKAGSKPDKKAIAKIDELSKKYGSTVFIRGLCMALVNELELKAKSRKKGVL